MLFIFLIVAFGILGVWSSQSNPPQSAPKGVITAPAFPLNGSSQPYSALLGTSTNQYPVGNAQGYNQAGFYAAGHYWAYWADGTHESMVSSTDGVNWSGPTEFTPTNSGGSAVSGVFDGTYFHYVNAEGATIKYRRGIPNSDGTITWSAPEQTLDNVPCQTGLNGCDGASLAVDTNGHVWVGFAQPYCDNAGAPCSWPWITENANTDGTWKTGAGFPFQLNSFNAGHAFGGDWGVDLLALTGGKVQIIYSRAGDNIYSQLYNPADGPPPGRLGTGNEAAPGNSNQIVMSNTPGGLWGNMRQSSAIAIGDTVYYVYDVTYGPMEFVTGTWPNFAPSQILPNTGNPGGWPLWTPGLTRDSSNSLYVFWAGLPLGQTYPGTPPGAFSIYYAKYSGGSWGPTVQWLTDTTGYTDTSNHQPDWRCFTVFPQPYGGGIGITYNDGNPTSPVGQPAVGVWTIYFALFNGGGATETTTPTTMQTTSSSLTTSTEMSTRTTTQTSIITSTATSISTVTTGTEGVTTTTTGTATQTQTQTLTSISTTVYTASSTTATQFSPTTTTITSVGILTEHIYSFTTLTITGESTTSVATASTITSFITSSIATTMTYVTVTTRNPLVGSAITPVFAGNIIRDDALGLAAFFLVLAPTILRRLLR